MGTGYRGRNDRSVGLTGQGGTGPPGRFPLARLIQLIGLLQTERCPNARRLAEICEVSRRTIYRDLASLAEAGVSVLYRPDRQCYELEHHVFLQPTRLEEREALAILVLSRGWSSADELGQAALAAGAAVKLLQWFPDEARRRLLATSELVVGSPRAIRAAPGPNAIHGLILAAMGERHQLRLSFREGSDMPATVTKFSIYRMTPIDGEWCLIGRSTLHRRVLEVPVSRVEHAESTGDSYEIPPRFQLDRFLARERPGRESTPVRRPALGFPAVEIVEPAESRSAPVESASRAEGRQSFEPPQAGASRPASTSLKGLPRSLGG
jgi:predicted DNA-binding transcriptional regulator YafY